MKHVVAAVLTTEWMTETSIVRAAYPGRRDSQITDSEWQAVIQALRAIGQSKNIGWNEYLWRSK